MKRQPMGPVLGPWLKALDIDPPDAQDCARKVMARLPETRQRGRWWPPSMLDRTQPAFPSRELVPVPIPATNGRTSIRGVTMFSALKFLTAGVMVALFGGLLLAGVLPTQEDPVPAPATESEMPAASGIDILVEAPGFLDELVVDGGGVVWAHEGDGPGRLTRFDPDTGAVQAWSIEDDVTFGQMATIAPSIEDGVWLVGPHGLRQFDGERFVKTVETPEAIGVALETGGGALVAASEEGRVMRWDGSGWERLGQEGANPPVDHAIVSALALDSDGRTWVGWRAPAVDGEGAAGTSVYDGSAWTTYDATDAAPLAATVNAIAGHPDGSVWVATNSGLARFDDQGWTTVTPDGSASRDITAVCVAPDGTVWVGSRGKVDGAKSSVWRFDGQDWLEYGGTQGLPGVPISAPDAVPLAVDALAGDAGRVYVGTGPGAHVFIEGRWEQAWESSPDHGYGLVGEQLAVDANELWAAGDGLWHYHDSAWTPDPLLDDGLMRFVDDLALAPDGIIWAAGRFGISRQEGDRMVVVDENPPVALTVDADGTVWAIAAPAVEDGDCRLWTLRVAGGNVLREDLAGCPLQPWSGGSLAVAGDGALWAGAAGGWTPGGLARYDGERWEVIDQIDGTGFFSAGVLGRDADGAMWVAVREDAGRTDSDGLLAVKRRLVRFEGTDGEVVELPPADGWRAITIAPDGSPWAESSRGPARWDGERWTLPYEDVGVPGMVVTAVAPDGTVFGRIGESILRLPPRPVSAR